MKKLFTALAVFLLSACGTMDFYDQVRSTNRNNLGRLSVGMAKPEVLSIMGTETVDVGFGRRITNPYRVETMKGKDEQLYEILFYYTDIKKRDDAITDDELTPIVLKDGKVIGYGWSFLNENATRYKYQIDLR